MTGLELDAVEQELERLFEDGSDSSLGRAGELMMTYGAALLAREEGQAQPVQNKLNLLFAEHPWMAPAEIRRELSLIVNENSALKSRRRKVIMIADRVGKALAPHLACKPGCSHCCHMNTMIYEHEAIRLAEVTGRKMKRLPFRPLNVVAVEGSKFDGKPCPFLVDNQCSVYADRPLVCRSHHSLRDSAELCSMDPTLGNHVRPPMYDPDLLEVPYMELNEKYHPLEPWGNIAEFFPES